MSTLPATRFYVSTLIAYALLTTGLVFFLSYRLSQTPFVSEEVASQGNPREGSRVPSFEGIDEDGKPFTVAYDKSPLTLLCFLSSDCLFCHQAAPLWSDLANTPGIRLIGIALDSVKSVRARNDWKPSFRLVEIADRAKRLEFGVSRVPLTLAVNRSGKVVLSVTGVPDNAVIERVRSLAESVPVDGSEPSSD